MNKPGQTARHLVCTLIALVLCCLMTACEVVPPDTAATDPPSQISSQTSSTTAKEPPSDATDQSGGKQPIVGALLHRIDMPIDASLDACWNHIDEQSIPILIRGKWQINGLRIGILHAQQADDFAKALPVIYGESRAKLFTAHYPTPIRSTPRLSRPIEIDLTQPPKSPTLYRAVGGRLQLLARIGKDDAGQAWLELIPHHYKPRPDLVPRSPLEKQLDGKLFHDLSALLPVSPDTAVVVGLYRPPPPPEKEKDGTDTSDSSETDNHTAASSGDTDSKNDPDPTPHDNPEPTTPSIPDHLGKQLMTGTRAGKSIQLLMIISMFEVEPEN